MDRSLSEKIVRLERDLDAFKASQIIGNSSTKVYKILENYVISANYPDVDFVLIHFISKDRPFPKISLIPKSYTQNGTSIMDKLEIITPAAYYIQGIRGNEAGKMMINDTTQIREIDFPYVQEDATFSLTFDLYADTKGDVTIEYLSMLVPG